MLPIISMLVVGKYLLGQQTLGDFSLALLIGLVSGTYSSLFVAAPLTVALKEREPRWREIRSRLVNRGVDPQDTSWHGIGAEARASAGVATAAAAAAPTTAGTPAAGAGTGTGADGPRLSPGGHPPRPRKKKRRR